MSVADRHDNVVAARFLGVSDRAVPDLQRGIFVEAFDYVVAVAFVVKKDIVTVATVERVFACAAVERVISRLTEQVIITVFSNEVIIALAAVKGIVAVAAAQYIVTLLTEQ